MYFYAVTHEQYSIYTMKRFSISSKVLKSKLLTLKYIYMPIIYCAKYLKVNIIFLANLNCVIHFSYM